MNQGSLYLYIPVAVVDHNSRIAGNSCLIQLSLQPRGRGHEGGVLRLAGSNKRRDDPHRGIPPCPTSPHRTVGETGPTAGVVKSRGVREVHP